MANEISISRFTGMNNRDNSDHFFVKKGVAQPRVILNADVTDANTLVKRDGQTKVIPLTDGHSAFGCQSCLLVMDGTTLKRVDGDTALTIQDLGGVRDPMYYAEVSGRVYMSSYYWNGVFNPETNQMAAWGIPLPPPPALSATTGNLDPGVYHVCLTAESGGEISGNGPIARIRLPNGGGITISNRGANMVWCTDPNGDTFFRVGTVDTIVNISSVEPLPSFMCYPPPFLQHITYAFGRMWGTRDNILYYSEPFHPEWWKRVSSWFKFTSNITMIAKTRTGLFVGCEDRTYCLLGTGPEQMQQIDAGSGTVPGSLAYVDGIVHLGDTISPPEKTHHGVPVWVTKDEGIVVGNQEGRLFSLTRGKVKFKPGSQAASLFRNKNGQFQFMTSFPTGGVQAGFGMGDDATIEVVRNGRVI